MFESDPTGAPFFQQALQRFARPAMIGLTTIVLFTIIVQLAHACASRQPARIVPRHENEMDAVLRHEEETAIARELALAPQDRWPYSSISVPSRNVDKIAVTARVGESVLLGPYSIMFTMAMPVGTDTGVDYMARVTIANTGFTTVSISASNFLARGSAGFDYEALADCPTCVGGLFQPTTLSAGQTMTLTISFAVPDSHTITAIVVAGLYNAPGALLLVTR